MIKELFVSSTPHETKVGMVEDDQLAEIYLERENEYTLAGSIYKGRVTRVLPGMQSAFVDIGLERDAFLYVSDFMELEDSDEVDELPASPVVSEPRRQAPVEAGASLAESSAATLPAEATGEIPAVSQPAQGTESAGGEREERGGWRRGRRRRGGRRGDRGDRPAEARPVREAEPVREPSREGPSFRSGRTERDTPSDFGPPPGYQPILLPGESISKYQRKASSAPVVEESREVSGPPAGPEAQVGPIAQTFPEDEPLFTEHEESGERAPLARGEEERPLAARESESSHDVREDLETTSGFSAFAVEEVQETEETADQEEDRRA